MSTVTTSHRMPQAAAQPGRPASANAAVPKTAQTRPHTLSQNRARSALRAVVGSLPVRIRIIAPVGNVLFGTYVHQGERDQGVDACCRMPMSWPRCCWTSPYRTRTSTRSSGWADA